MDLSDQIETIHIENSSTDLPDEEVNSPDSTARPHSAFTTAADDQEGVVVDNPSSKSRRLPHSYSAGSKDGPINDSAMNYAFCECSYRQRSDDNFLAHYQQSHSHSPTHCSCSCIQCINIQKKRNNITNHSGNSGSHVLKSFDYHYPDSSSVCVGGEDSFPTIMPINVGGYRYMTRLSTLRKYPDSMLAAMFSGRHQLDRDQDGYYFIDSNGAHFGYILAFLRHDELPPPKTDVILPLYRAACYFGLTVLQKALGETAEIGKLQVKERHRELFPSYYAFRQQVIQLGMKNAVATKTGEVIIFAHQKESKNIHNNCITETAHLKIGPWEAGGPDEEIFVRTLHSDLLELGFELSNFDRRRCKWYVQGQTCQRCVFKLTFHFQ